MNKLTNVVPGIYRREADSPFGKKLISFLNESKSLGLLEGGVYYKKPSVYGISDDLKERFSTEISKMDKNEFDRYKQFIGNVVKQIMLFNNYKHIEGRPTPISDIACLFRNGARYKK